MQSKKLGPGHTSLYKDLSDTCFTKPCVLSRLNNLVASESDVSLRNCWIQSMASDSDEKGRGVRPSHFATTRHNQHENPPN
jgi:hypothetical protein